MGYTATDGSCKESSCTVGIPAGTVSGYQNIDTTNDALKTAVAKQPASVCVKADSTFQSYRSGVLSKSCSGQINHAVIAVGYSGITSRSAILGEAHGVREATFVSHKMMAAEDRFVCW